jgi:uncharacterized protein YjiS (DUF1127 family)
MQNRTTFGTAPARQAAQQLSVGNLIGALNRLWSAYQARRREQAAIAALALLDDRDLKDIGLHRSQIVYVVREGSPNGGTAEPHTPINPPMTDIVERHVCEQIGDAAIARRRHGRSGRSSAAWGLRMPYLP